MRELIRSEENSLGTDPGKWIDEAIREASRQFHISLADRMRLREGLLQSFRGMDIIEELLQDREVTEIMINGPDRIFIERRGHMMLWKSHFETRDALEDLVQQMVSRVNRTVNASSPIADARLPDGSRVHVVLPPLSLEGPVVTIRKFPHALTMEEMIAGGSISREAAGFLRHLVRAGYNIFISGGTNSGKTTFLNALSAYIPKEERVITIEDSAELQIQQVSNLVRLETRVSNGEGDKSIGIGDLIRASLRMNPSRIIVGEVRGAEALELLNSYNTGHDGGMSTGHGNSPADMLARLETMVLMGAELPLAAIRSQIASALDIMIHLGRLRDRSRRVLWICEVDGVENGEIVLRTLYHFREEKDASGEEGTRVQGRLEAGDRLRHREKLLAAGEELEEQTPGEL